MNFMRLVKRNILVYTRDKSNIFFSFLSMIIIIGLMVLFLGNMNIDNIVEMLKNSGGVRDSALDRDHATNLVLMWSIAGIVVVNSVTVTLALVGIMVQDEAEKRLSSFFVSPRKRGTFVLGYIVAAIIMGIIMCSLTVVLSECYIFATGGTLLTLSQLGSVFLSIILSVFASSCMVFFITMFVHTTSAFSGMSTVVGTLVGFLAAIYLPMGMLPAKVQSVLKCIPLIHESSLMREIFTDQALKDTFMNTPKELSSGYKEYMGITVNINDKIVSNGLKVAFLLISGIIFITASVLILRKRHQVER